MYGASWDQNHQMDQVPELWGFEMEGWDDKFIYSCDNLHLQDSLLQLEFHQEFVIHGINMYGFGLHGWVCRLVQMTWVQELADVTEFKFLGLYPGKVKDV